MASVPRYETLERIEEGAADFSVYDGLEQRQQEALEEVGTVVASYALERVERMEADRDPVVRALRIVQDCELGVPEERKLQTVEAALEGMEVVGPLEETFPDIPQATYTVTE